MDFVGGKGLSVGPLDCGSMAEVLRRYRAVISGVESPGYLRLKRHPVEIPPEATEGELWDLHDEEMERFWEAEGREECSPNLLDLKTELAERVMHRCRLCRRRCLVDRASGEAGHCGVLEARVASEFLHMGEEPPLVPSHTVFFAGCTLDCVYCQNHDISTDPRAGQHMDPREMADRIEARTSGPDTRKNGRNVNWVGGDPTPNLHYILQVLQHCRAEVPQIWNSNLYLSPESMDLLEGVIDLFLTDFKYGNDECAQRLSDCREYIEVVATNHVKAARHADVLVRHLVLPGHLDCCTVPILRWIRENLPDATVNVMGQYRPMHKAKRYKDLRLPLRVDEFRRAHTFAKEIGLEMVD